MKGLFTIPRSDSESQVDGEEEIEIPVLVDFLASELFLRLPPRGNSEVLVEAVDFFSHQGLLVVTDRAVLALHLEPSLG